jgi:hypothetical protein
MDETERERLESELRRVALSDQHTGQGQQAKVAALRKLLGPRRPEPDPSVARLFDESRDPQETVHPDDWHPDPERFGDLDAHDTVEDRRRWYRNIEGQPQSRSKPS